MIIGMTVYLNTTVLPHKVGSSCSFLVKHWLPFCDNEIGHRFTRWDCPRGLDAQNLCHVGDLVNQKPVLVSESHYGVQ